MEDAFNPAASNEAKLVKRKDESAPLYKFWLFLKKFPRFFRYFVYLLPGAILLLIPILMAVLAIDQNKNPVGGYGGTPLMWFGIWLQIIWGALWVSRMVTSLLPPLFQSIARVTGSTNPKKWKDVGRHMELHTALFLWLLAVLISFKPIVANHRVPVPKGHEDDVNRNWINIVFKVIIAFFVLATLNFVEKIIIQWIATAFHERTYATRIENNKGDIRQLVALYDYAKSSLEETDSFWNGGSARQSVNGTQTPMQNFHENARQVLGKVGQVAGKVGNDFIGRKVDSNHPRKVVSELLRTTTSSHTLARLIYRSLVRPDNEMVFLDDVHRAFNTKEEAEAAFNVFDKDLNGDISMEEFETVTNEISMEKKAIAASLKDLDSVIQKLDQVFLFIIVVVTIIVFISIISGSAAAGLASAGSSVLGLAWMLQATAQEFLQSIIFVFVKHPFDVGDRVTIYGSTGATMTGDDYYVTEISLLYTEFKKLQGHVVQAPNSLLNTLFILNQRRSNGLADPIPLTIRFGTPAWQIDELKARMLDFCLNNKRDYQPTILMELSKIADVRSATLTVVFIHKSNFQNELLRLARLNKFMMELMAQMADIGIQSPFRIDPGGSREHPMHWTGPQPPPSYTQTDQGPDQGPDQPAAPQEAPQPSTSMRRPSVTSGGGSMRHLARQTTSADMALNNFGDVFENRREHFLAGRLASIREKTQAEKKQEQKAKKGSELGSEGGHGSTSALAPVGSVNSQSRSRMWQRPRGNSRFAPPPSGGQGDDHIV
ncbi:Mechanosensitive ion channel family protein [Emericellopsis atlantica]|uniref:Mechanosensitive ion channel protein n=1 Tax=Emericellopsis atlantica TaxID=2614577 RepID=A0A9P7ZIC8_9HYPO|nr:Mechanosensitive ion channel family protein [Emericellopsis atlantica]KAG9252291.1 Mechanosensitive ion channel family protein [Emericellopsis atlantica]